MFIVEKYKGRWAILDTTSCVWYFAKGKRACEKRAKELNEELKNEKI